MILALLAMDLVWLLGLALVSTPAAYAAFWVFGELASPDPWTRAFAFVVASAAFVATYAAIVSALLVVLPSPRAGRHPMLRGRDFYLWAVGFIVRRWLDVPPISVWIRQSAIARLLVLRAAGAKVHPSVNMSSDVVLLDPYGVTIGEGTILGFGVVVSGHMVVDDGLSIADVRIGSKVEAASEVRIGPGVTIGDRVQLGPSVIVGPLSTIGDDARVGMRASLGSKVQVGARAKIAPHVFVPNGTVIPEDGSYPGTEAPRG